jgi:hypothetical protein
VLTRTIRELAEQAAAVQTKSEHVTFRLTARDLDDLKTIARNSKIGLSSIIHAIVSEKLAKERQR